MIIHVFYACSNYTFVGYDMMQDGWNGGYVQIMGPDTFLLRITINLFFRNNLFSKWML